MLEENPSLVIGGRKPISVRDSDIALMIVIWQRWYNVGTNEDSFIRLYRLFDLPREDNIKRVRAVFQNVEHKYLPTDWKVAEKRGIEREIWEAELGYSESTETIATHHQTLKATKFYNPNDPFAN